MASLVAFSEVWPEWLRWGSMAFVIMASVMLCRRYAVARLLAGAALLFSGLLLLGALPWPAVAVKQQFVELALVSIGAAWVLEEFLAMLALRRGDETSA